jgi:hypothetical protein
MKKQLMKGIAKALKSTPNFDFGILHPISKDPKKPHIGVISSTELERDNIVILFPRAGKIKDSELLNLALDIIKPNKGITRKLFNQKYMPISFNIDILRGYRDDLVGIRDFEMSNEIEELLEDVSNTAIISIHVTEIA